MTARQDLMLHARVRIRQQHGGEIDYTNSGTPGTGISALLENIALRFGGEIERYWTGMTARAERQLIREIEREMFKQRTR